MGKFAVLFLVLSAVSESPAETVLREFHSSLGVAKLILPPQAAGAALEPSESRSVEDDTGAVSSIRELRLPGETLLLVHFQDGYSGEEIHFPVRVSQMLRFFRNQAKRPRAGTREDRLVAGIQELSRELKVRMRSARDSEGGK